MIAVRVALVGDYSPSVRAHVAIPPALQHAARVAGCEAYEAWMPTPTLERDPAATLDVFDAVWCVPASPYASMDGALAAIRYAREHRLPFLGTCGGFQHAVLEYARNVLGLADADHAETNPGAARPVISALACSLVGASGRVRLAPGSRAAESYGATETVESYHCNYGVDPAFHAALEAGPLRATGWDDAGDVRVVELDDHPFFVASLFQPELSSTPERPAPLVTAFVRAMMRRDSVHGTSTATA